MGKRKRCDTTQIPTKKLPSTVCILHDPSLSQHGNFTNFSVCKGESDDKLSYIHDIRDLRLSEPVTSPYRMNNICDKIPSTLEGLPLKTTGYHQNCYKNFTMNLGRLKNSKASGSSESSSSQIKVSLRHHKSPSNQSDGTRCSFLFPNHCIFCEKVEIKVRGRTERPVKFQSWKHKEPAWKLIAPRAQEMNKEALYRTVQGNDLYAMEARYHPSCRNTFSTEYQNYVRGKERLEKSDKLDSLQAQKIAAYQTAYDSVKNYILRHVIECNEVIQLTFLRNLYIEELDKCGFPNPDYRSEKLINHLQGDKDISQAIAFSKVPLQGCVELYLIYSSRITLAEAISCAYKLGATNQLQDVALTLRSLIIKTFKESKGLSWPPTAQELNALKVEELLPDDLVKFMSMVLSGIPEVDAEKCEKTQRLVYSISQDVCRAATNGQWKLPKHILLCATLRHLYRSKQLTTILARLGHSETYNFSLELETALTKALDETSTYLTPQIITGEGNAVFHNEWDNLNKITTNVHGSNIVNSAGGIMIQEVREGHQSTNVRTLPFYERSSKMRTLKLTPPETLPELAFRRIGPKFPQNARFTPPAENQRIYDATLLEYYIYLLCRHLSSEGKQQVPGFGGFISSTGKVPPRKSTIDYYTPINQPITENAVVYELLKRSEAATQEVGQPYTINTFDLGVVMKACPIVWKYEEEFNKHIIIPGKFHTVMNYIGMLTGHKCRGAGYSEILIEAGLATSGCLKSILSGKSYAKALFSLKVVTEALEQLLLNVFLGEENVEIPRETLVNLIHCCTRENLDGALKDTSVIKVIHQYTEFQQKVREGHLGKTGMFWLSVMDHARLVFMMDFAVKTNNFELFHHCNGAMADLFFAYDGHNYSRYLTWFEAFLTNIDLSHPGACGYIKLGGIAVARSLIPGALSAVDKTMEETFMKFAKSSGGLLGIFNMFSAYKKWCRTTSARAQLYELTLEMCSMIDDPDCPKAGKHRELDPSQVKKYADAVQRVVTAITGFTNPWMVPDKNRLFSIASGAPMSQEVEADVLQAEAAGKAAKEKFIQERFVSQEKGFFDRLKKLNLKTMDHCNKKVKLTSVQGKLFMYQEQSNLAFQLLVKSQMLDAPTDLEELMRYPLSPVPHALASPDGFFAKTNKATILHYLLQDEDKEVTYPRDALFIQDGNALFHMMNNLAPTFGEICLQLLDQMSSKEHFVFSTDCYKPDSIKAQERLRRGFTDQYIINGPHTRKPRDFRAFLGNEMNKNQLCTLLLKVWASDQAATLLKKCKKAVLCTEGKAYHLTSTNDKVHSSEIYELCSDQEETDSRVILYLHQAVKWGYKSSVVRTPDTDILMILLYHAKKINLSIYLDHGSGVHRKLINVSELAELLGPDYCSTLLGYYVFSGEDCTSAFKGKGKVNPLKKLQKNPKYHNAFSKLGKSWLVPDVLQKEIEAFTCLMYGYSQIQSVDAVRAKMLRKMVGADEVLSLHSKVDLERLPPPKVCLIPHVQRCNYRVACYKRADQPIFERPKPYDQGMGWEKTVNKGELEPIWSVGPILPPSLIEILAQRGESEKGKLNRNNNSETVDKEDGDYECDDEEEMEIQEIDIDDLFSDDDDDDDDGAR